MDVEFKVSSEHLGYKDLAIDEAIDKYTSPFWPFGREGRARKKLEEKQKEILEKHDVEDVGRLGITKLVVRDAETKDEAEERMESFEEDLEKFYKDELGLEEPLKYKLSD